MRTLVFGEILWDIFGEERVIGGAAFNFSAHLVRLGGETWLLSGVGADELGQDAREQVRALGVRTEYLRTSCLPTGACHVTLDTDGKPSYRLLDQVGYDDIVLEGELPGEVDMLYLGTLARRSDPSRKTASALLQSGRCKEIFYDINIRKPFISREVLEEGLRYATILKISREECGILAQMELVDAAAEAGEALCRELSRRYPNLSIILMTLDKDGAMAYDASRQRFIHSIRPTSKLVSAVGAGDSFSACFAYNYMNGHSIEESLNRGVLLSDYVVTQMGAIPAVPEELLRQIRR